MEKYVFEVHTYAPELNKIYYNRVNISSYYSADFLKSLAKDYKSNLRALRAKNKPLPGTSWVRISRKSDGYGYAGGWSKSIKDVYTTVQAIKKRTGLTFNELNIQFRIK